MNNIYSSISPGPLTGRLPKISGGDQLPNKPFSEYLTFPRLPNVSKDTGNNYVSEIIDIVENTLTSLPKEQDISEALYIFHDGGAFIDLIEFEYDHVSSENQPDNELNILQSHIVFAQQNAAKSVSQKHYAPPSLVHRPASSQGSAIPLLALWFNDGGVRVFVRSKGFSIEQRKYIEESIRAILSENGLASHTAKIKFLDLPSNLEVNYET